MKTLNVTFTDEEFKKLSKAKARTSYQTWYKFILTLANGVSVKRKANK